MMPDHFLTAEDVLEMAAGLDPDQIRDLLIPEQRHKQGRAIEEVKYDRTRAKAKIKEMENAPVPGPPWEHASAAHHARLNDTLNPGMDDALGILAEGVLKKANMDVGGIVVTADPRVPPGELYVVKGSRYDTGGAIYVEPDKSSEVAEYLINRYHLQKTEGARVVPDTYGQLNIPVDVFDIIQDVALNVGGKVSLRLFHAYNESPWICFDVGDRQFGIWRETLKLYEADSNGAMGEDPIDPVTLKP